MTRIEFRSTLAALALAASAAVAAAQSDQDRNRNQDREQERNRQQQRNVELQKCSELIGWTINTEDDQKAGKIKEIALDLDNGRPFYCIVDTSGVSGMNDKLIPVPFKAIDFSKFKDVGRLNVNMSRWHDAPDFKETNWGFIGDAKWGRIVHQHYAVQWQAGKSNQGESSGENEAGPNVNLVKATDAMKFDCYARQREKAGQCRDFIIDTRRATIPLVLVSAKRDGSDRTVAVPFQVVNFNSNERALVLRVEREKLAQAPEFDRNTDLTDGRLIQRVYAHYNVEADGAYGYVPPDRNSRDDRDNDDDDEARNRDRDRDRDRDQANRDRSEDVEREAWTMRGKYGKLFRADDMTNFNGRITNIERITPMSDMSPGVKLVVRGEGDRKMDIHLGPWWYLERQLNQFREGDEVRVNGSRATLDGERFIIASEVRMGNQTMVLRDRNGNPIWDAWSFQPASR